MVTQTRDGAVEFRFFCPAASVVTLAGEFNGWHQTSLPMTKGPDGWWRRQLRLAPGCYKFRYVGDGQWYTDYAAFGLEHGPFGPNSVVKVDLPKGDAPEPAGPAAVTSSSIEGPTDHPFADLVAVPGKRRIGRPSEALAGAAG